MTRKKHEGDDAAHRADAPEQDGPEQPQSGVANGPGKEGDEAAPRAGEASTVANGAEGSDHAARDADVRALDAAFAAGPPVGGETGLFHAAPHQDGFATGLPDGWYAIEGGEWAYQVAGGRLTLAVHRHRAAFLPDPTTVTWAQPAEA